MQTIRYHTENGVRHGLLVKEGYKKLHVLLIDTPITVRRVPVSEARYMEMLDIPVNRTKKAIATFVRRTFGTLRQAPQSVREALQPEKQQEKNRE
jgi:hypothetical protein